MDPLSALTERVSDRRTTGAAHNWGLTVETGLDLLLKVATTRRTETSTVLLRPHICPGDALAASRNTGTIRW